MKRLFLALLAMFALPAAVMPPRPSMVSLERLPTELKNLILLHTGGGPNGILNVPALAQGVTTLSSTSKALHSAINNPQNMLIILKLLPRAGAKLLAERLQKMPGMKSKEVQDWLKSFELEGGQELYNAVSVANPDIHAIKKMLANQNISVNWSKEPYRDTALISVSAAGYTELVRALLAAGADVDAKDFGDNNALVWATINVRPEVVKALLAAGANVNTKNNKGETALSLARERLDRAYDFNVIIKLLEDAQKCTKRKNCI